MFFKRLITNPLYLTEILLVLGILVLLNVSASRHFVRMDLTSNKEFTLSEATREAVSNLGNQLVVECFFSQRLPAQFASVPGEVRDMLDEYKAFAGENMAVTFTNPKESEETEEKVRALGIQPFEVQEREKDQVSVKRVYMGIAVSYLGNTEVLPNVVYTNDLEYQLTMTITKVTSPKEYVIGLLDLGQYAGGPRLFNAARQLINKEYDVLSVDFSRERGIPEEVTTLIVGGAQGLGIPDRVLYEIDQFLMRGGKIFFILDPVVLEWNGFKASPNITNLDFMLSQYGVKSGYELVVDEKDSKKVAQRRISQGIFSVPVAFQYWPWVTDLNEESVVTGNLQRLLFPMAAPVQIDEGKVDNARVTILAQSSDTSWTMSVADQQGLIINPSDELPPNEEKIGPHPMMAVIEGTFHSYFEGKDIPEWPEDTGEEDPYMPPPEPEEEPGETIASSREGAGIVVCRSGQFVEDPFYQVNGLLLMNLMDYLNRGSSLIGIRTRQMMELPLKEMNDDERALIKAFNIGAIPLLVILFAVMQVILRSQKRRYLQVYYRAVGRRGKRRGRPEPVKEKSGNSEKEDENDG